MALSIPCHKFKARLRFESNEKSEFSKKSNDQLRHYLEYLKSHSNDFKSVLNLSQLEKDIDAGLYFDSSIPISYGVGSSGALCAALYKRYGIIPNIQDHDLLSLKEVLAGLEAGFHGKSSGLDPLISFLNQAILIVGKDQLKIADVQVKEFDREGALILIDTGQKGDTAPLVRAFMDQCKDHLFQEQLQNELIPITNQCINSFCAEEMDVFFQSVHLLSKFQYNHFEDKIPNGYKELWKTGIDSRQFSLKLCGSGGGGFLLCFTRNAKETESFMDKMGYSHQRVSFNFSI
jgi:mevalonate kinase